MRKGKLHKKNQQAATRQAFVFEELEPRVLLSADLPLDVPDTYVPEEFSDQEILQDINAQQSESRVEDTVSRELIFVDTDTPDYQTLLSDLLTYPDDTTRYQVFELDNTRDGIAQITEILGAYNDVSAVHILSHGGEGAIDLGGSTLDSEVLAANAERVTTWGSAFTHDGDILIYGCDLAATSEGQMLVNSIATLTGADVAASDDLTGNAQLGGDWELEYSSGLVETPVAMSVQTQQQWSGVLAENQAPVNSVPGDQTTPQDTPLTLSTGNGNLVSISDPDAGANEIEVTLTATNGTLTLDMPSGTAVVTGSETAANTTTTGSQVYDNDSAQTVAVADDGSYVVVWSGNGLGDADGIFFQRFDASGTAVGNETLVNVVTTGAQTAPAVGMDGDGNFVVAWQSDDGDGQGIFARRFDSSGSALSGEITVNNDPAEQQVEPSIAVATDGSFVVAWSDEETQGNKDDVFARIFDSSGTAQGLQFQVNSHTSQNQYHVAVAIDAAGNFVVAWGGVSATDNDGISARGFDASGAETIAEFQVNSTTTSAQFRPSVGMDAAGNFVVTWMGFDQPDPAPSVLARGFDANGTETIAEFLVTETTVNSQQQPAIAMDADGDFVIVWTADGQDGDAVGAWNVYARQFEGDGTAKTGETLVNTTTTSGNQVGGSAGMNAHGDFVVSWTGSGGGDADGVFTQRFDVPPALTFATNDGDDDVTMTFTGSIADINAAFDGMVYTPDSGFNGTGTITITTDDLGNTGTGGAQTDVDVVNILVGNANAPVIDLDADDSAGATGAGYVAVWNEGGGSVAVVDADATLSDSDENLTSVAVTITNLLDGTAESLSANPGATGLAVNYNSGTGVLTISGAGTAAQYQQVLRTVTYNNTSDNPTTSARVITFTGNDAISAGNTATTTLTIQAPNDAPVNTVPGAQTTPQDTSLVFNTTNSNLISISDLDAGANTVEITLAATNGTLTLNGGGGLVTVSDEITTNTDINYVQTNPTVAMDAAGGYVAVWQSTAQDTDQEGIFAQRYDADGIAVGSAWQVNTEVANDQSYPAIAMDAAGNFVITWQSEAQDQASSWGIYAQRYSADGTALGSEFLVNTSSKANHQNYPDIAMDSSGNFVIVWQGDGAGDSNGVFGQRFNNLGVAQGGEFLINTYITDTQWQASVDMNASGEFVVAWSSETQDGGSWGVYAQIFNADGSVNGSEIATGGQGRTTVVMKDNGEFVIGWVSGDINARVFDASGTALTSDFAVNTTTTGAQTKYDLALTDDDGFIATWSSPGQDVRMQKFDWSGTAIGPETLVNSTVGGTQVEPTIASNANGDYVVLWRNDFAVPNNGIYAQHYVNPGLVFSSGDGADDSTMIFTGTIADINTVLEGATFNPDSGFNGTATVTITTDDQGNTGSGGALSDTDVVNITVGNPNAPVINLDADDSSAAGGNNFTATWIEDAGAVLVADIDATFIDADENLSSLAVTITNLLDGTAESLTANAGATGLAVAYNSGTGVLTISGAGTAAQYQQVLRTVTYNNTSQNATTTARIISFTATDALSNGNTAITTLAIDAVNDEPVNTVPGAQTTAQDTDLVFSSGNGNVISVSDVDADTVEVTLTATNGTVMVDLGSVAGDETLINAPSTDVQEHTDIAVAADGSYVVVWSGENQDGAGFGIFAQRFDATGTALTGEIQVNTSWTGDQTDPVVAIDDYGKFVVAWETDHLGTGNTDIFAQRFDAAGNKVDGEFQVDATAGADVRNAAVAMDADGDFVIAFENQAPADGDGWSIYAHRYNSAGASQSGPFLVNSTTAGNQAAPSVAMDDDGDFVVAWGGPVGVDQSILFQRYDSNGNTVGDETVVAAMGFSASVSVNASGEFVVVWQGSDTSSWGVYGRQYDATGTAVAAEFQVNTHETDDQVMPDVALADNGEFVVTWQSYSQDAAGTYGIYAQRYNALGATVDGETLVNTTTAGGQVRAAVAIDDSGRIAVTWNGNGDGDADGISVKRYGLPVAFSAGDGTADATMTFSGSIADVNAALDGLIFTPTTSYNGPASLEVLTSDLGATGTGGTLVDTDTIDIVVGAPPANNAPTDLAPVATSSGGLSLNEDGGNDAYLLADDGGLLLGGLSTVTVETTFSISAPSAYVTPLLSYAEGTNDEELGLFIEPGGAIWFMAHSPGSPMQATASQYPELFDGEIHHVAVSWDASSGAVEFYIDGAPVETFTGYQVGETIAGGGELVFGNDQDSVLGGFQVDDVFAGTLHDVRIFNDVRTAGEIAASYDQTLPNTEPGMIANWNFDDLSSNGVITDTVSGNNLTVQHIGAGGGFITSTPGLTLEVAESSANNTVVGSVAGIDPDVGDTFSYTLTDDAGGRFDIHSATGEITVANGSLLDYEAASSHDITVRVTDSGGLTYDEVFTIAVTDANDAPTFGVGDGAVTNDFGFGHDLGYSVALQDDGKILVAGQSFNGTYNDFRLTRYNADGTLDTSFGGTGSVTEDFGGSYSDAYSVVVQPDGKILVAGNNDNGTDSDLAIVRYNADGTLDTSFDGDGKLTEGLGAGNDIAVQLAVQSDGKILLTGSTHNGTEYDMFVRRYEADGSVDTGFGTSGTTIPGFGAGVSDFGRSVTVQSDGKILVAGSVDNGTDFDYLVMRLNTDGTLDTSFSGDGIFTTSIGPGDDVGRSVQVQDDGKILLAGRSQLNASSDYDFSMIRLDADGTLDTSFDGDGKVMTSFGTGDDYGFDMAIQADGKIVVVGNTDNAGDTSVALVRYNADGSLDTSFDGDGKIVLPMTSGSDKATAVAIQDDGKIVVSGDTSPGGNLDVAVLRYNSDGALDDTFDDTGSGILSASSTFVEGGAPVVLDSDVTIYDAELSAADNFDGASLTLVRNGGANGDDVFSATGTLATLTEGGDLDVGGTIIGTVMTNSAGTLVLTFNANASNSLVNSAMQQIAYSNSSGTPPASVQIDWTFDDGNTGAQGTGGALQALGSTTVSITALNDNPVANADTATTAEDVALNNIDVLANDADVDGDTLSVTGATALNGSVSVNPDGTLNYTPNADFNGTDTISYDISDGNGGTDTGTLTITVTAVNDNPVANADTATTSEDVALNNIDVLGNDADVDGDALSVTGATAANGTVTVNPDGTLNYTPNLNFNGTDTISYDISDGNGGSDTGTLTITVSAVNDNPVANADTASTAEDVSLNNINVLGNDTDVDGDTLSVTGASATNGTVTVNGDGTLNYTPNANFNGTDTISYDIADGNGGVDTGTLTITVTAVNDNPVANADTATTAEDVALNNIDVLGNDTDVDGDVLSVTGASATNGTVTVNGDGTLNYTPNLNFNGTDTISYDISDGNGGTDTGTLTITVTAVNDNPVANADTASTAEDIALNNIDVLANDTDVDGDALSVTGATAANGTVTVNPDGTLNYTPNLNFNGTDTISYDISDGNGGAATGTLTITVTAVNDNPVANADTDTTAEDVVLNNIDVLGNDTDVDGDTLSVTGASALNGSVTVNPDGTLNYTPNLNFNGTDTISYDISDGNGGTDTGTLTITVTAVNDNPVANADTASTAEDIALNNIDVLANDTDVDGDVLSVTGATAANGTVTVNPDGTLNYTPNLNFNGTDTISYDISDGNGGTDTGTLTITVTAVNDNPVANADTATTAEDMALNNIDVLANDTDVDGDTLSVTGASALNGSVTVNPDGTLNYTPNLNFNGTDTISYDLSDGNGGTDTGTLTITVTAVNDNPVANADIATTAEDVALNNIDVLGNDTDVDGDVLSVTGATAANGTVTVNGDGTLNYTPNLNFNGTDTISYDIADGNGGSDTGTLTITVTAVNDNPVANADTATTAEDVVLNNIDVLGNDTDVDGDTLSVTGASALNGTVTVNGDGTLNYTPNLNFNGTDTISYDIADGNGGTDTGTLTITVTAVNDNSVANADTATTAEDVVLNNIDVLGNDTDVDGDILSVTGATAANGTVTVNPDGTLNYTPNLNFNGTDTISYDLSDGNGGSDTGTLTITVTAVNDNPVANADTATTSEDMALNNIDVLANDTDVDGDALSVTGASALNGTVTVNGDGTLNYTPNLNFNGTDTISYDISDGNGGTDTGTLTITVTAVNDNPVANADTATTAEDVALNNIDVLGNDTDVDGDTLSVTGATATNGSVTVNPDGTLNYTPTANFNSTDTISYDLNDGNGGVDTGTLTITVTAVNDNPVANADTATTAEDVALNNIDVLGNDTDVDGDTLSVTGATATNGSVTVNPDGTLNYTPNLNFNGTDTISYDIADGNGGTDTGTLTITVTAVNDNPVANADTASTNEDVALNNIDVLGNDTDVDGDTLSVTGASAANGSVTVNPDGTLNYTPTANFNGTDTISYDIADGNGGVDTGTLTITVNAVNDNPVANADTATTAEDVALNNIDVLGNDTDVDGDTLSVTGASAVNGSVTVNPDGTLNYTPTADFNGTDTISYDIADGNGGSDTGTLTITVSAVNDNPVANADTATTAEDVALNNIDVLGNDTDVDGDTLSVTGATAANGAVTVNGDGTLNYTPNLNFNGTDTISYDIADGNGGTDNGALTITVTAVNDNPVANADTATTAEDVALNNIDVLGNDTDVDGDVLSVTGATAANGTVTVNPDGTLNYTPNLNFNGTDTISYDIADGNGGSDTGTLTITVTGVNNNPVANADTATTSEDVVLNNIDVLGNDTDVDGDTLSVTGASSLNGTVTVNGDGTLNYTPNGNFNGSDTISYDIADGNGGVDTGTLTITVTAVNDNPVANADTASTNEDVALNNIDVLGNDTDVDGDTLSVTGASATNGSVTVNPDGTLNYTPNGNFNGTDTISYDLSDGNGGSDTGTLTITVNAVNDNPVANADTATTAEDVALNNIDVLGNDTDVDGDTLSVTGATATNGSVTVNPDGTLNYTPNLNFNGTDTISYDISDGNGGAATGTLTITVTAVNDNPVANADTDTTAEDVVLNNIDVLGNDTDVDGDTLSVTGASALNGSVTVNPDGTLNYTPNLNFNGTDTISYDISDGNGGTDTGTLTITVTAVNDNPVANADTASTAEDIALNNIDVLANDTDVDGDALSVTGATAANGTVTVNPDGTLNYTPDLNFNGTDTISYDIADGNGGTATGTLTITVTAVNDNPVANADTDTTAEDVALNNIDVLGNDTDVDGDTLSVTGASALNGTVTVNGDGTLNYTPNLNFNGTDTISYDISDGNGGTDTGTLTITVTAVNNNPVANADTATTSEDVTLNNIDVLGNDTDVDGDTLTVTGASALNGSVTVNPDGTLNYTPNLNFNGTDTISYGISDGNGGTATGTLTITVTAVNDNPVANSDTATTSEDVALNNIDVLSNDADVDGDVLSVTGASATNGTVTVNPGGTLNYTPNLNFNGTDTVTYDISDGQGGTATGTLTITVTAVNDNPVANADTATTSEDVSFNNIDVLGNDTDVDGDILSVTGATAANGTVTVNPDGTLNYTPNLNFNGTDTISYGISDGNGGTDTGTLTITVTAVNDNPVANADTATTSEDVALNNIDVLGNDTDVDGDVLSVTGSSATNGTVTVNPDGTLNYTPNLNFNGTDTISYDLSDGNGGTDTGTLTITVTAVNDNPVANADTATTAEDVALNNINVLANDSDVDGDTLSVTGASALNGTVTVNGDGTLNYTPNLNFNGTDTISYDIADGNGGFDTGTLTITVTVVNDNPVANADTAATSEDVALNNIDVLGNDTDVDGDTLSVTGASALNGSVTVNPDGTLNYTPNLDFNGTDTIGYDISDGNGGTDTGTLTITVTAVNDNPEANADTATTSEDVALNNIDVLANDTDVDGDTLSVTGASATNGTVTVNPDGTLNYTPNQNFNGTDTISYDISDGNGGTATGTLTITVTAVNDNPVANADTATTAEDVALNNIDILGNDTDVDGDTLSVTGASAVNGSVTVNPDGTLNYTPNLDFNGTDTISYDISDGNGGTDTGTLTITITAVNDNPVANADTATTAEDIALNNIDVLGNDTDVDGDILSVTGASAANGTVMVNPDGTLNYTPNLNFNGTDTISYDIADGNGGTATGALTITVTAVNDNPVANADTATTSEDVALNNIDVLGNDTDVDGDALSVTGATAANGTVTVNPDGTLNYTPNLNFNGTDTISYDLSDGNGGTDTGTLTITVTAVNDNPVANADTATSSEDVALNNIDVLGNDSDVDGDVLSVTGATAANGTVTVNPDGTLNYTPNLNFNGTDTISYDISDGNGGTDTGTLTITVTAVNDNPVANADSATTSEDATLNNIDVLGNDTDVDGDVLSVTGASALNGAVIVNPDGTLNYTPHANYHGVDTINYDIADGNGGISNAGTVDLTVTAVNDAPVNNIPGGQTTSSNTPLVFSNQGGNSISVTDLDGTGTTLQVTLTVSNGTLNLSGTSGLVFNAGDGIDDSTVTFTGTAADINAALDGLLFQPDASYQGFATVQLITDDLGNSGSGGVLNAMDSISISVVADAPVSEELPPLDELIIDYPDVTVTDPDPVSSSPTVAPASVSQETSEKAGAGKGTSPGSGTHAASLPGRLHSTSEIPVRESIVSHDGNANQEQEDGRSISTRIWNALADPLVSVKMIAALPPGAVIWDFLDQMTDQINKNNSGATDATAYMLGTTATGVTFAFSAGYVSWLLRAGYLSAALLSAAPLWRQFDPLPILGEPVAQQQTSNKDNQTPGQADDSKVDDIFEPGTHRSTGGTVS